MVDYTRYHPAMIALTERGYAFIYWMDRKLVAHTAQNYGRGQCHWFEYLGKQTKEACEGMYPHTPILSILDSRINKFCQEKIREMETLV